MPLTNPVDPFSDNIVGTDGDDFITSFVRGSGTINSGAGNDTIRSFLTSDDTINAGSGRDFIDAGPGNDTINAGTGVDAVFGGLGSDTFVFTEDFFVPTGGVRNFTQIADFSSEDIINLEGLGEGASFADFDTNGDGLIGEGDDDLYVDLDGFVYLYINGQEIAILNIDGIPPLTEDLFAFA